MQQLKERRRFTVRIIVSQNTWSWDWSFYWLSMNGSIGDQWFSPLRVLVPQTSTWFFSFAINLLNILESHRTNNDTQATFTAEEHRPNQSHHCWSSTIYRFKVPRWSTSPHFLVWWLVSITKIYNQPNCSVRLKSQTEWKTIHSVDKSNTRWSYKTGRGRRAPSTSCPHRCSGSSSVRIAPTHRVLLVLMGSSGSLLESQAGSLLVHQGMLLRRYAPPVSLRSSRSSLARFSLRSLEPGLSSRALS